MRDASVFCFVLKFTGCVVCQRQKSARCVCVCQFVGFHTACVVGGDASSPASRTFTGGLLLSLSPATAASGGIFLLVSQTLPIKSHVALFTSNRGPGTLVPPHTAALQSVRQCRLLHLLHQHPHQHRHRHHRH